MGATVDISVFTNWKHWRRRCCMWWWRTLCRSCSCCSSNSCCGSWRCRLWRRWWCSSTGRELAVIAVVDGGIAVEDSLTGRTVLRERRREDVTNDGVKEIFTREDFDFRLVFTDVEELRWIGYDACRPCLVGRLVVVETLTATGDAVSGWWLSETEAFRRRPWRSNPRYHRLLITETSSVKSSAELSSRKTQCWSVPPVWNEKYSINSIYSHVKISSASCILSLYLMTNVRRTRI